jgi:hypothetical protein
MRQRLTGLTCTSQLHVSKEELDIFDVLDVRDVSARDLVDKYTTLIGGALWRSATLRKINTTVEKLTPNKPAQASNREITPLLLLRTVLHFRDDRDNGVR